MKNTVELSFIILGTFLFSCLFLIVILFRLGSFVACFSSMFGTFVEESCDKGQSVFLSLFLFVLF